MFHQFEHDGLLSFQTVGVQRIEQVNRKLLNDFLQEFQAAIKIRLQLQDVRSILERLRELAGSYMAAGQKNHALHSAARRIGRDGSRGIARGRTTHAGKSLGFSHGDSRGDARVLERAGGIHSLVLDQKIVETERIRSFLQKYERRVALSHRDNVLSFHLRKQLAEAPDTTGVFRSRREPAALLPNVFQIRRAIRKAVLQSGIDHFQQLGASAAPEHRGHVILHRPTLYAAQEMSCALRIGGSSLHHRASLHLAPRANFWAGKKFMMHGPYHLRRCQGGHRKADTKLARALGHCDHADLAFGYGGKQAAQYAALAFHGLAQDRDNGDIAVHGNWQ